MDFTLENFDFKVNTLTTVAEIDQLLEEQALQIKGFEVKTKKSSFVIIK